MLTKFGTKDDVSREAVDAVACNFEVGIPDKLAHGHVPLLERAAGALQGLVQPVEEIHAVRFRVYPARVQQQVLKRWIGAQRYIYNQKVEELGYQLWLKNNAKFSNRFQEPDENYCPWDQTFSKYKESAPWLEKIPSFIRRNGCSRFRSAMAKWGKSGGPPQLKTRKSVQSVLLTSECFTLRTCDGEDCLFIGTKSNNLGVLKWVCHCEFKEPRQISITHEPDGKWFVGFNFESGRLLRKTTIPKSNEEVLGLDRGVVNPVTDSTGRFYDFTRAEKVKLNRREKKRTKLQVRLARQKKGSKRRTKTKRSIAITYARDRRLRVSVAHRIANHVVNQAIQAGCKAIGVEDLRLDNMTRTCKARQDDDGIYLPNGQAAKSGLTRSLLGRGLGQIKTFVEYRCQRVGLIFIQVDPAGTSTECTECHHKDKRNRVSQSDFECVRCHHIEHADVVGGTNTRDRAFKKITEISPGTSLKMLAFHKREKVNPWSLHEPRNTSKTRRSRWVDYLPWAAHR
jgi:putative transposase